jgi:transcriptional regulator with GAF, ATPase, and Fis domain
MPTSDKNNAWRNFESDPSCAGSPSIFVIDSAPHRRRLLDLKLSDLRLEFVFLDNSSTAADVEQLLPAAIVLVALDGTTEAALQIVQTIRHSGCVILCYADGADDWPIGRRCEPLLAGAEALLDSTKPGFSEDVAAWALRLLAEARAHCESAEETRGCMRRLGLVGRSEAMLSIFRKLIRFAPISDLPVLLLGETGTGKEVAARAIHALDPKRRSNNFVPVNCSAMTASLVESELFGHRRGAFTGAEEQRKGLFRAAAGGTLFLDEIGEMDLALQAKLLRVLQERRVLVVGEDREVPVDVRVIAASNRNLTEAVNRGTFRSDLLHRLNVLSLVMPPLRERPEDIEMLIKYILEERRSVTGKPVPSPSQEFVDALQAVELRGNVREVMNLVHHALANNRNDTHLELQDLKPEVWAELAERARTFEHLSPAPTRYEAFPQSLQGLFETHAWNFRQSVDSCERLLLEEALRKANGNQSQAARLIGLSARSLYNKLHKHRLNGPK